MMKNLRTILLAALLAVFGLSASAQIVLLVQEPANLSGSYSFTYSSTNDWGADMDTIAITADAAFAYDDGTFTDPAAGAGGDSAVCGDVINRADIEGKIAVLYRGTCNFSLKAKNVQDSGAVALIIINNIPGGPVGMGAGTNAAGVVIPVAMIGDTDGAALRDSIMAGSVEIFLGNNTGLYPSNIGAYRQHIGMAKSQSTPVEFAETSTDFNVPVGAWVHNYGSAEAVNVVVSATIERDGNQIYDEASAGANIPVGDSLFFSLALFSQDGYEAGVYTIDYSIVSDDADQFPDDNTASTSFWINGEGIYSKSMVDPVTGPVGGNGIRPADGTEYEWCVVLQSENAEAKSILGMTFSIITNDVDLTGEAIQLAVYEWNDPIADLSFTDLNEATDNEFYDFATDAQGEFVTHTFSEPVEILNDQRYLACATVFTDDVFIAVDASLDYNVTYDSYPDDVFFPLNDIDGGAWFAGGFGTDNVPALIVNLGSPFGIAEDLEKMDITPFPNPTVDRINIPLGTSIKGDISLEVYDVEGRLVMSHEACQNNSGKLSLDCAALSSGLHTFNLRFEDNTSTAFRVMITK
ncbi:MAG: hypothetical protein ACI9UR_001691 [Bacteroidia bacterium]|jgi:hypothetical protein